MRTKQSLGTVDINDYRYPVRVLNKHVMEQVVEVQRQLNDLGEGLDRLEKAPALLIAQVRATLGDVDGAPNAADYLSELWDAGDLGLQDLGVLVSEITSLSEGAVSPPA